MQLKAELILESVHKDLAEHFQTPPVASTQLLGEYLAKLGGV